MKQQLDIVINKLVSDPYFAVTIANADSTKRICVNKTGAQMIEEAGSVQGYFNEIIVNQGNSSLVIQPRRKNGSSFKDSGEPQRIDTTPTGAAQPQPQQTHQAQIMFPSPTHQTPAAAHDIFGLMGGMQGEMIHRHFDHPRLVAMVDKLTLEVETLKKDNARLERDLLETEYSENKAAGNKEMLSGLFTMLGPIVQGLVLKNVPGGEAIGGLGAPAPQEDLAPIKLQLIDQVKANSDNLAFYLLHTIQGINTNLAFGEELAALLDKHNLIPKQNNVT